MEQGLFTYDDAWHGGAFELAIEVGDRSDTRLREVLRTIWQQDTVRGCYLRNDVEPTQQSRLEFAETDWPITGHLYGIATLPNRSETGCSSVPVREDMGPDWVYFGVPMSGLALSYPVGAYPFEDGSPLDWRLPITDWLRLIGTAVYEVVPYRLGRIGWIMGGDLYAADIAKNGIPNERWEGMLWPEPGGLAWYPPNQGAPIRENG